MSDPDLSGNKTVFRPSPLQALKAGGQPPAPVTASPPPPQPPVAPPPAVATPAVTVGGRPWRMALIILFAVVTVLALGYIAVQLTGRGPGSPAAVKTGAIAAPSAAPARGASA